MKRYWLVAILGLVGVAVAGAVAFSKRPELLAAVKRWDVPIPPALDPAFRKGGSTGQASGESELETPIEWVDDGWCATHGQPEAGCEACNDKVWPEGARPCAELLPLIRLKSPAVARRIGIETAAVEERLHADTLIGNAEVVYDGNAYAEIRPRVAGFIHEIRTDEGSVVKAAECLIVVNSAEVGSAKAAYLGALPVVKLAEATMQRTRSLTQANALPLKDELEAQTSLNRSKADLLNATQRLRNLGFSEAELAQIASDQDTSSLLEVVSPIEGTVVQRHAVSGEAVEASTQLFGVADLRNMWAWIDVYENEIGRVKAGQAVRFWIGGADAEPFLGHVDWIDAAVNPTTRTIRVRAILKNEAGRLRANQFGQAEILVGQEHEALFIPRDAVQTIDEQMVVFLAQPDGTYRPQRILVETGERLVGEYEVEWGLKAGDLVVTTGAFLLKSEVLRDQLGGE